MAKGENPPEQGGEAAVIAHLDLETCLALVSDDDADFLLEHGDFEQNKGGQWVRSVKDVGEVGFEVVAVSRDVVSRVHPKEGAIRTWRRARCGHSHPAQQIPCFRLSTGRYAKIDLAGYSHCVRSDQDETCEESYVKIGEINIYWDAGCSLLAQRHRQFRWVCLP
jgi:hypothetical protein